MSTVNESIVETAAEIWGIPLQAMGCSNCGQAHLGGIQLEGAICPNCGVGRLSAQPARLRSEPPERIIPFQLKSSDLPAILDQFVKDVWLRPDDFNTTSLAQRAVPVFLPMWLVDSTVQGTWEAEAGFDYQVKSSQENFQDGRWQTRERVEGRVSWVPRLGQITRRYENIAVPALNDHIRTRRAKYLPKPAHYHLEQSVPYQADAVGGACLRIPDLQHTDSWEPAKYALDHAAAADCTKAAAAQHMRNFILRATYNDQNWTQLLLPVFFTYYSDDAGQTHPIYINAQSGAVSGVRLASQRKGWRTAGILAGVALLFFLLCLACFALTAMLPVLAMVGTILAVLAFSLGAGALVPAIWPWQWNRGQEIEENKNTGN
jgi:hypothetical protein